MIDGLRRIPLQRFDDDRGWFSELARASDLPKPIRQVNLSRSRQGVIRGLHYHGRGQDDRSGAEGQLGHPSDEHQVRGEPRAVREWRRAVDGRDQPTRDDQHAGQAG